MSATEVFIGAVEMPCLREDTLEATVIGVPDEKWGVVVVYLQPCPDHTVDVEALKARCGSGR